MSELIDAVQNEQVNPVTVEDGRKPILIAMAEQKS